MTSMGSLLQIRISSTYVAKYYVMFYLSSKSPGHDSVSLGILHLPSTGPLAHDGVALIDSVYVYSVCVIL
jgi:hypothetical protein